MARTAPKGARTGGFKESVKLDHGEPGYRALAYTSSDWRKGIGDLLRTGGRGFRIELEQLTESDPENEEQMARLAPLNVVYVGVTSYRSGSHAPLGRGDGEVSMHGCIDIDRLEQVAHSLLATIAEARRRGISASARTREPASITEAADAS